jgi:ubiquinol-cytochrome c reductase cytochrome b subunit
MDGSTSPLGFSFSDYLRFYPKFLVKDIHGFLVVVGSLVAFTVFFFPNYLGHPDNYIRADAMVTPKHIVPEWYFLPFYAILRSIPNKLFGVIAMFSAIIILFFLPYLGSYEIKTNKFFKLGQFFFWCFVSNFLLLGWLGACVVEQPYIVISQISTIFYFSYFLVVIPVLSIFEKYLTSNRVWKYKNKKIIKRLGRKINYK